MNYLKRSKPLFDTPRTAENTLNCTDKGHMAQLLSMNYSPADTLKRKWACLVPSQMREEQHLARLGERSQSQRSKAQRSHALA